MGKNASKRVNIGAICKCSESVMKISSPSSFFFLFGNCTY